MNQFTIPIPKIGLRAKEKGKILHNGKNNNLIGDQKLLRLLGVPILFSLAEGISKKDKWTPVGFLQLKKELWANYLELSVSFQFYFYTLSI
jgi:hypothetical protein